MPVSRIAARLTSRSRQGDDSAALGDTGRRSAPCSRGRSSHDALGHRADGGSGQSRLSGWTDQSSGYCCHHRAGLTRGMARAKTSPPIWIKPQLAALVKAAPDGPGWLHEMKLDGYRMHAWIESGTAKILTRRGNDWTGQVPDDREGARRPTHEKRLSGRRTLRSPP